MFQLNATYETDLTEAFFSKSMHLTFTYYVVVWGHVFVCCEFKINKKVKQNVFQSISVSHEVLNCMCLPLISVLKSCCCIYLSFSFSMRMLTENPLHRDSFWCKIGNRFLLNLISGSFIFVEARGGSSFNEKGGGGVRRAKVTTYF